MTREEIQKTLNDLEALVKESHANVSSLSFSSIKKVLRNVPTIIDLSFKLTKAVIEKVDDLEQQIKDQN